MRSSTIPGTPTPRPSWRPCRSRTRTARSTSPGSWRRVRRARQAGRSPSRSGTGRGTWRRSGPGTSSAWSDGQPFTSDDFRFWWEDVALDKDLSPTGPDVALVVDGEPPEVEFPDGLTVRYSWSKPNPFFLPALSAATELYIYRPAHYLKQ